MNLKRPSNRLASIPYRGVLQTATFEPVVEYWQSMGWIVNIRIKASFAIAGLTRKRQCWVELTATTLEGQPISDTLFATIPYKARTNEQHTVLEAIATHYRLQVLD